MNGSPMGRSCSRGSCLGVGGQPKRGCGRTRDPRDPGAPWRAAASPGGARRACNGRGVLEARVPTPSSLGGVRNELDRQSRARPLHRSVRSSAAPTREPRTSESFVRAKMRSADAPFTDVTRVLHVAGALTNSCAKPRTVMPLKRIAMRECSRWIAANGRTHRWHSCGARVPRAVAHAHERAPTLACEALGNGRFRSSASRPR